MTTQSVKPFVSVIIPAHNEEQSLPHVLADLPMDVVTEVIVVDNDSKDQTAQVAQREQCRVVFEPHRGYGQACLAGMRELNPKTDIVVFIDGDHSDYAEQLTELIQPILLKGYDFVIGSRAKGIQEKGAMTPQQIFGNRLACFLMKCCWGVQYSDLGPFRAIRYGALQQLRMSDQDFGWTIEMQIRAHEQKLKTIEVPVNYRCRIGVSKISGTIKGTILAGSKILWTIFRYRFLPVTQHV